MFGYDPGAVLPRVTAPIVSVRRAGEGSRPSEPAGVEVTVVEVAAPDHNLLRYRPADVTAAILGG